MTKITLDKETFRIMGLFQRITHVTPKDAFEYEDYYMFIVGIGTIKKCLGRDNRNIKKLSDILKKKIKLIEHSTILSKFIKNVLFPSKILDVENKAGDVYVYININQKKTINAKSLNMLRFVTKRYFDINNIYLKIKK